MNVRRGAVTRPFIKSLRFHPWLVAFRRCGRFALVVMPKDRSRYAQRAEPVTAYYERSIALCETLFAVGTSKKRRMEAAAFVCPAIGSR